MKKYFAILFSLSFLIAVTGCVETIVMDPDEDLPVMVNCLLSPDNDVQTLYLQYVKGKSQEDYVPITKAKVYVIGAFESGTDTLFFYHDEGNRWKSKNDPSKRIESNRYYALGVEIPGRDTIKAETVTPISHHLEQGTIDTTDIIISLDFPSRDGWYLTQIRTSPVWVVAKGKHKIYEQCDEYYPYIATDNPYADDFNINGMCFKDLSITGENDGTGEWRLFRALFHMRRTMPGLPLHDNFVRFDHLDTNCFRMFAGPVEYPKIGEAHQDHFLFMFVSDEYDKYLRSVYVKNKKLEHDITSIYSTENTYSNIKGGVGIFGSVITCRCPFLKLP